MQPHYETGAKARKEASSAGAARGATVLAEFFLLGSCKMFEHKCL